MQSQEVFTGSKSAELFTDFIRARYGKIEIETKGNAVTLTTDEDNDRMQPIFHETALAFRFAAGNAIDLVEEHQ